MFCFFGLPDVAAFAYSAARLPDCMPIARTLVLGQSKEQFEAAGFAVRDWARVGTRGRRRALRWNGKETLACFITSNSDIDDLVPGDAITLELPYATVEYRVTGHRIVDDNDLSVLESGDREELVLQACHPRFFASQRYLVYARPVSVEARS